MQVVSTAHHVHVNARHKINLSVSDMVLSSLIIAIRIKLSYCD